MSWSFRYDGCDARIIPGLPDAASGDVRSNTDDSSPDSWRCPPGDDRVDDHDDAQRRAARKWRRHDRDRSSRQRVARATAQKKGRYKKDGDKCIFDANDSGPDQCTPPKGRYKKEGDRCVWVAGEDGGNQCTPKGRWKKDGDRCYFDAKDEGPDQCMPPKPR